MCVVIGWQNGKVEIRAGSTGESLFKTNLGSTIAKILWCDYKLDGEEHVVCVTVDGGVTGFLLKNEDHRRMNAKNASTDEQTKIIKSLITKKNVSYIPTSLILFNRN